MPSDKQSVETASSPSSSDDESSENVDLLKMRIKKQPNWWENLNVRRNCHPHRGVRRLARLLLLATLLPVLMLLVFYLPLYTNEPNRHVALPDWTFNTSRNVGDYVLPLEDTTIIEPHDMCKNKVFVVIIVCSSLHNFVQRQTIRDTWGNTTEFNYSSFSKLHAHLQGHYLKPTPERLRHYADYFPPSHAVNTSTAALVRIVFLLGRSKYESFMGNETLARLHNEAEMYNDIIQENFIDSYNNLTIKSVLALKYMKKRCLDRSEYFMKCDDDTFVNVPNLVHFLLGGTIPLYNETVEYYDKRTYQVMLERSRLNQTRNLLVGHLFCTAHPLNDVNSKWYMPNYMYPGDTYPKYLSGAGYLMSIDVVPRLYDAALNTSLIYLEDVYVTGMCAEAVNLKRRHQPLFSYTRSKHWCTFKGVITQHELKEESTVVEAWQFISNYSIQCPPPSTYFKQMRIRKGNNC